MTWRVVKGNGNILCLNAKHSFDLGFRTTLHHHVRQIVDRFRTMGSVMKRKFTARQQTDQNIVDQVEELVAENPHSSTRRMSAQTNGPTPTSEGF
jgi:hypothetical protein